MLSKKKPKKGTKKLINAWAFYDWANSVYSLVITTAIFPLYYAAIFVENNKIFFMGYEIKNTAMISFLTAFAFVIISLISPILAGIADFLGNKKRFMQFFVFLGSFSCIGLFWFDLDNIYTGLFLYFLALIGFWASLIFYNSYLPDVAYPEQQDRASAKGYSLGYIGSVILLLFNLSLIMQPDFYGISGNPEEARLYAMKISFVCVGLWWLIFSQISFFYLPKGEKKAVEKKNIIFHGYRELKSVYDLIKIDFSLKRFLLAFFVYSLALQTIMLVAAYFGEEEIIWSSDQEKTIGLIVSILLIQLIAIFGAIIAARASIKYGNIPTLFVANILWGLICIYAYYIQTPFQFYLVAGLVGMVMGGLQSTSRATYSKYLPNTKDTASYFSFYGVTEKIAVVFGMTLFGMVDQITGSMRLSVIFFMLFFLVGGFLILSINTKKGKLNNNKQLA